MVRSTSMTLALISALQVSGRVVERQTACVTGVHMIVARASTEDPGTGIIGQVANNVKSQIPDSDIVAVDYPALLSPYVSSQKAGVTAMTKLVQDYAKACPQTKMVLMGYSQGAHVTADVLCGTSEMGFAATEPQSADITDKVAAVLLMGDPSHVNGQPYNQGSSTNDGLFPRRNTAGCDAIASKTVSFCNTGDPFCDGGADVQVHLSYIQSDGEAATNFLLSKAKAGNAAGNATARAI